MLLLGLLQVADARLAGTRLERALFSNLTVAPSAAGVHLFDRDEGVRAEGNRLASPRARLTVLPSCEGTEVVLLWLAAVLAYPAPWRRRVLGAVVGSAVLLALNQGRVVALYYALANDPGTFAAVHGILGPTLMTVLTAAGFVLWAPAPGGRGDGGFRRA